MMETTSTSSNPDLSSEDDADLTQLDRITTPTHGAKKGPKSAKRKAEIDLDTVIPQDKAK